MYNFMEISQGSGLRKSRKYLGFWGQYSRANHFLLALTSSFSTKFAFQTFRLLLHLVVLSFRFYEYTFKILGIKCYLVFSLTHPLISYQIHSNLQEL